MPSYKAQEQELVHSIKEIFRLNRNNYATRKEGKLVSRHRIAQIMKQEALVSNYTVAQFKPHISKCNETKIESVLEQKFHEQPKYHAVVSDLTYVRVEKT